jgi:hypothetical protein
MPNLDAFAATGGFAQFVPDANRAATEPFKDKIAQERKLARSSMPTRCPRRSTR